MANNGADIYLLLLRPTTRVPIPGEAVSHLFQGQMLLETLTWNLHNEEERVRAEVRDDMLREKETLISQEQNVLQQFKDLKGNVTSAQASLKRAMSKAQGAEREALQEKHDRLVRDSLDKFQEKYKEANASVQRQAESKGFDERVADKQAEQEGRNRNFEFTFSKGVDIATTQMLNSMKAGDIFPSGTLTIHQRSASMMDGTSLIFTIQKIRLLEYRLKVSVSDTMTDMVEEWTCEFGSLAYVYKNPPSHYTHGNTGQAVVKTATQGTSRAFTMKNIGSPI